MDLRGIGKKQLISDLEEHKLIQPRIFSPSPPMNRSDPLSLIKSPKQDKSFLKNATYTKTTMSKFQ